MAANSDSLTLSRAETLARKVSRYWRRLGYENVRAWAEPVHAKEHSAGKLNDVLIYQVRSNLVNGLPPRVDLALAA